MTTETLAILRVLLDDPAAERYGLEVMREAGLRSGTLYPALARLERAGWVESAWEQVDPSEVGRPRRRLYRLTGAGEMRARAALDAELARLTPRPRSAPGARPGKAPA